MEKLQIIIENYAAFLAVVAIVFIFLNNLDDNNNNVQY